MNTVKSVTEIVGVGTHVHIAIGFVTTRRFKELVELIAVLRCSTERRILFEKGETKALRLIREKQSTFDILIFITTTDHDLLETTGRAVGLPIGSIAWLDQLCSRLSRNECFHLIQWMDLRSHQTFDVQTDRQDEQNG